MAKKKKKQNKPHGHFCYVCGEHKANEKFSGQGHANHICRQCHALPAEKRNEMIALRKIDNMAFRYISEAEIKWLRKKMNSTKTPEVSAAAREVYNMKFHDHDHELDRLTALKTPVMFSELDNKLKSETLERLEELIADYFEYAEYLPDNRDKDEILSVLCDEISETLNQWEPEEYDPTADFDPRFDFGPDVSFDERIAIIEATLDADAEDFDPYDVPEEHELNKELLADDALKSAYDKIVARVVAELKDDGFELQSFADSLLIAETERLIIRQFYGHDLDALWAMMKKPEVMYAWEHGFNKKEVRKWLNRQYTRYREDGYGYFAVTLKKSRKLIGQAGLMKGDIDGESIVEIGYIFKDNVWGKGYAIEAARACVDLAFNQFGLDKLYATIRPENVSSIKVVEKLGMEKVGKYVKVYNDKEMPHDIFVLENMQEVQK